MEQRFSAIEVDEFEGLFNGKPTEYLTTVAAEGVLELAEKRTDFKMPDHDFNLYLDGVIPKYFLKHLQKYSELYFCLLLLNGQFLPA